MGGVESASGLELSSEAMRALVDAAMEHIVRHIATLAEQPASSMESATSLARALTEPAPEAGVEIRDLLHSLFGEWVEPGINTAGPGYLAYMPGGGVFAAAVADLIADAVNKYVGVWHAAPLLVKLEANVLRWFADIVGFPAEARGILTTGGSLANFSALLSARRAMLPEEFSRGTIYASDQAHHSIAKAAAMAGFPLSSYREIPSDDRFRIDVSALRARIDEDRASGLQPFFVAGSAGTTGTGAVDELDRLADVAEREHLWFHVDAAYGGFFALTSRGRDVMHGISRAHSVTLDPHKALFLPYGLGCLLVRDGEALKRAHSVHSRYYSVSSDPEAIDFCLYSPELTRDFRGLRAWLPIKLHGLGAFRAALDEKLELAAHATEELRKVPGMEIVAEPELSVVTFRYAPSAPSEEVDALNRRVLEAVNAKKRVFIMGLELKNRFALRLCILSFRTHRDRIDAALEDIRAAIAAL